MKKNFYFDDAIRAFYRYGCGEIMTKREGQALERTICRLTPDELMCVVEIYMPTRGGFPSARDRGMAVRRLAMRKFYSEKWIFEKLASARRKWAEEAGIIRRKKR